MDLHTFFMAHPAAALAFSGGADSSYLLYAAKKCGADVKAYYVKTAFQPAFELRDARELAASAGASMTVIDLDVLGDGIIAQNPPDRCYFCKKAIAGAIAGRAAQDGYSVIIDGTNASDDAGDRAGTRAIREMGVLSPLRECGLTKDAIRALSKEAGLKTWDKPAYSCLATRIPAGRAITAELLQKVEKAEDMLFSMGFTDFRVRVYGGAARLQLPARQYAAALEKRGEILACLKKHFDAVLLDLEAR